MRRTEHTTTTSDSLPHKCWGTPYVEKNASLICVFFGGRWTRQNMMPETAYELWKHRNQEPCPHVTHGVRSQAKMSLNQRRLKSNTFPLGFAQIHWVPRALCTTANHWHMHIHSKTETRTNTLASARTHRHAQGSGSNGSCGVKTAKRKRCMNKSLNHCNGPYQIGNKTRTRTDCTHHGSSLR